MSFPEEPLDFPPDEGGGYYPATIRQKLDGGKYEIVRKLGYGPRSSTWLVWDQSEATYFAVKIFTIAASEQANQVELPILKSLRDITSSVDVTVLHESFWEKSDHGSHLCAVINPLSTSIDALQRDAENQRLPVHAVQRIVWTVAYALKPLHRLQIMHGAINAENIVFSNATQTEFLQPVLDSEPAPTTTEVGKYIAVRSQPLVHGFRWNNKQRKVADWPLYLDNFGHAQRSTYKPEPNVDYLSAPETLLQGASCSPATDIWMLGHLTFTLLTGRPPFSSKGDASERIEEIRAVLEDEVPEAWLNDAKLKKDGAAVNTTTTSIEASLARVLHKSDVATAAAFIKGCLRLDPSKRFTAAECSDHKWLAKAGACSCRFC